MSFSENLRTVDIHDDESFKTRPMEFDQFLKQSSEVHRGSRHIELVILATCVHSLEQLVRRRHRTNLCTGRFGL